MAIHHDVAMTVDRMLRGVPPRPEIRERALDGQIEVIQLPDEVETRDGASRSAARSPEASTLPAAHPEPGLPRTGTAYGVNAGERMMPARYERERAETPPRNAPA